MQVPSISYRFSLTLFLLVLLTQCGESVEEKQTPEETITAITKLPVLFDTDANNELDDQHAMAYLLLNGDHFSVKGITVNATPSGGEIDKHYDEAERILKLCKLNGTIPLYKGANANFEDIKDKVNEETFDGYEAVNFIIEQAQKATDQKLILIPVGKLTNIALALKKEPSIANNIRIVWLGSNYPKPGEYNQNSDIPSMNYVLNTNAPFEMVTVRYGDPSGTDAIKVTQAHINETMPGKGPKVEVPITGRHGGTYHTFGDYAVSLFEHIDYHSEAKDRALFDLAAVAIIKNPSWAKARNHPCPIFQDGAWVEQSDNPREIVIWENFDKENIIGDLYRTLDDYTFVAVD